MVVVLHAWKYLEQLSKLLVAQAVQQLEAQFAKEMGAEAREKRIDT